MTNTEWKEYTRDRLTDLGFDADSIFARYTEEHRFYHTIDHVFYILKRMEADAVIEQNVYFLSAVFHDYYYDPTADIGFNEIKSEELFRTMSKNIELSSELIDKVSTVILESDIRQKTTIGESELFRVYDLGIFEEKFSKLMDYELKIFKEYQHVDWKIYQEKRIEFLKGISKKEYPVVEQLLEYVKAWIPNIGLYVGSFNPFHKGHLDILKKAEAIFDKVIVAAGINPDKSNQPSPSFPPEKLRFRQTVKFTNLLTDFIDDLGYDVTIVVGIRNQRDLEENMNAFYFHQDFKSNTKMIALFSDRNFLHVSSTNIRLAHQFDKPPKYDV